VIAEPETAVPGIAIVRSSRSWARTLHRYVVDHGGAVVRTRPLEERQALEDDYELLIVDDISSFLTAHIVEELHRRGRRVLGVYDPEENSAGLEQNTGKARLLRLGADGVIESQAPPEEFVRVIARLAPQREQTASALNQSDIDLMTRDFTAGGLEEMMHRQGPSGANGSLVAPSAPRRRGHITALLGASGGSGATEIALELGRSLARRGERTTVVDGDTLAPSLAQRLNLPLHPNLRTAIDVVEHGTGRLPECLIAIAPGLEVLAGIPHPKDWVELRSSDMTTLLNEIARGRPQIVVNIAPELEDLTMYGGADRFGISRTVVAAADAIVLVCAPTPTGVARLVDRIAELDLSAEGKPVHVVVNRTPKSNFKRKEIALEIERAFAPASIHFLPADARVDRASWEGTLVPDGDFTKAVASSLAAAIPRVASANPQRAKSSNGGARNGAKSLRRGA